MKKTLMILTAALLVGTGAQATLQPVLYYSSSDYGSGFGAGAINTTSDGIFTGPTSSGVFTTPNPNDQVVDLSVTLNVSGGYNGDMYAYLVAPNGTIMLLMDGGASGLTGSGMNSLTLVNPDSTGRAAQGVAPLFGGLNGPTSGNINSASDAGDNISGTYGGLFTLLNSGTMLGNRLDPNGTLASGTWNLYLWQQNDSTSNPQLNGWTLNLAVVPEPVDMALGLFAAMLLAIAGVRHLWTAKEAEVQPEV